MPFIAAWYLSVKDVTSHSKLNKFCETDYFENPNFVKYLFSNFVKCYLGVHFRISVPFKFYSEIFTVKNICKVREN